MVLNLSSYFNFQSAGTHNEILFIIFVSPSFYEYCHGLGPSYLESVVRPATKLHITVLVIERKPGYVNLTRGLEYSWGNVGATPRVSHNYIGWECPIKLLICAEKYVKIMQKISF